MSYMLAKNVKVIRAMNAVAAGTTDQTSSWIDTAGFDGIVFITAFGTITSTAVTSVKIQQSTASDGTNGADLEGTSITVADDDDNQMTVHDIYRPRERYLAAVVDRGTANAVIDGIVAILYNGVKAPVTHDASTVVSAEYFASPAEGTA